MANQLKENRNLSAISYSLTFLKPLIMKKRLMTIFTMVLMLTGTWIIANPGITADLNQLQTNDCQILIDDLYADVGAVEISIKDENGLVRKLRSAGMKLNQGKTDDAIKKLVEFSAKVSTMRDTAKPKISDSDAQLLLDGAADVMNCILGF